MEAKDFFIDPPMKSQNIFVGDWFLHNGCEERVDKYSPPQLGNGFRWVIWTANSRKFTFDKGHVFEIVHRAKAPVYDERIHDV